MLSLQPCSNTPTQWRLFIYGKYTLQIDTRSGKPTLMISIQNAAEPVANLVRECPKWDGLPLTLDVSATFPEGAAVRDYFTLNFDQQCWQPADAIKLNQMLSLQPCSNTPPQWRLFRDGKYTLQIDPRSGTPTLMISIQNAADPVANLFRECP